MENVVDGGFVGVVDKDRWIGFKIVNLTPSDA